VQVAEVVGLTAAQFWASRVQRQPDGSYSINHVIPVDERLGNTVNNSMYVLFSLYVTLSPMCCRFLNPLPLSDKQQ
jgi:trehalose/maltose hydrolase-like predicted phosphorylase